jgi:hypothetical protein
MSYLRYMCLFGSSLPPVVCRKDHVLFMLFVFVWFVLKIVERGKIDIPSTHNCVYIVE